MKRSVDNLIHDLFEAIKNFDRPNDPISTQRLRVILIQVLKAYGIPSHLTAKEVGLYDDRDVDPNLTISRWLILMADIYWSDSEPTDDTVVLGQHHLGQVPVSVMMENLTKMQHALSALDPKDRVSISHENVLSSLLLHRTGVKDSNKVPESMDSGIRVIVNYMAQRKREAAAFPSWIME